MKWIYIFGSILTGDVDAGSDVDVLVVTDRSDSTRYPADWSVYSATRLRELFERGTLFAWHLHLESELVYPAQGPDIVHGFGQPAPYHPNAAREIRALREIASTAMDEIAAGTPSWIYERGMLYVALRDTAMAASSVLGEFCFSKRAPLKVATSTEFPLTDAEYDHLMECRRGCIRAPEIEKRFSDGEFVLRKRPALDAWLRAIEGKVCG